MHEYDERPPADDNPHESHPTASRSSSVRELPELTLAQLIGALRRDPLTTGSAFWQVLRGKDTDQTIEVAERPRAEKTFLEALVYWLWQEYHRVLVRLPVLLYLASFWMALHGNRLLVGNINDRRSEAVELAAGLPYLLAAVVYWLIGAFYVHRQRIIAWGASLRRGQWLHFAVRGLPLLLLLWGAGRLWDATDAPREEVLALVTPGVQLILLGALLWFALDVATWLLGRLAVRNPGWFPAWLRDDTAANHALVTSAPAMPMRWEIDFWLTRAIFGVVALLLSVVTWIGSTGNRMNTPTIYLWLLSAVLWSLTFAPRWNLFDWLSAQIDRLRMVRWRKYAAVMVALVVIMLVGAAFRFHELAQHPLEMTDDHVEKILDAGRVRDGLRPIFFANNGGREPFQMYVIALASYLPGLGINHYTIKVVAALESLLTIPVFFWLGYALLEGESKRRRLLMGLLTAALLAVSYWHVAITRQALRIALTPLVASLLLIFLMRAMRHNRRADFIRAGLVLGFGLYMYQAVRMLPVVIVVAVGIAIYFVATNWRERWRYVLNLAVLVWLSFMIFLPMFHYSLENPELFWRRATGRLLGDDVIEETLLDGSIVMRDASLEERLQAFQDNVPVLMNNIRNVLLMFNWKGDVAAISGVPNQPALDSFSGALLIVGLAAWGVLLVRRRDSAHWLIPVFIFIMLLPSALSIAFPVENPSHTRTSGAMPGIYLLAALPLVIFAEQAMERIPGWAGKLTAFAGCTVVIVASYNVNTYLYFEEYPPRYLASFDPYTEPGSYLQGFVLSGGSFGNAFMIGYEHWWSHRAIGLAAGLETEWPNGIVAREQIPAFLNAHAGRTDQFRFDPSQDILFFFSPEDQETARYLQTVFPGGYLNEQITYKRDDNYMVYRVPALGQEGFQEWLAEYLPPDA